MSLNAVVSSIDAVIAVAVFMAVVIVMAVLSVAGLVAIGILAVLAAGAAFELQGGMFDIETVMEHGFDAVRDRGGGGNGHVIDDNMSA